MFIYQTKVNKKDALIAVSDTVDEGKQLPITNGTVSALYEDNGTLTFGEVEIKEGGEDESSFQVRWSLGQPPLLKLLVSDSVLSQGPIDVEDAVSRKLYSFVDGNDKEFILNDEVIDPNDISWSGQEEGIRYWIDDSYTASNPNVIKVVVGADRIVGYGECNIIGDLVLHDTETGATYNTKYIEQRYEVNKAVISVQDLTLRPNSSGQIQATVLSPSDWQQYTYNEQTPALLFGNPSGQTGITIYNDGRVTSGNQGTYTAEVVLAVGEPGSGALVAQTTCTITVQETFGFIVDSITVVGTGAQNIYYLTTSELALGSESAQDIRYTISPSSLATIEAEVGGGTLAVITGNQVGTGTITARSTTSGKSSTVPFAVEEKVQ